MNSYPCGCRPGRLCAEHVPFGGEQPNASVRRATVDLVLPADTAAAVAARCAELGVDLGVFVGRMLRREFPAPEPSTRTRLRVVRGGDGGPPPAA